MIMKVLSKNRPVASFHRAQSKISLVSPYEHSLSGSLLKLLGFHVDVVPFASVEGYENKAKIEAEARVLMQGTSSIRLAAVAAEEKKKSAVVARPRKEERGFLGNLMERFLPSKKMETLPPDEEEEIDAKPEPTAVSWSPLVLFEHVDPIPINRLTVKVLHVPKASAPEVETPPDSGDGKKSPVPSVLPLFFANTDIEKFAKR
jgi:hypothetical protein